MADILAPAQRSAHMRLVRRQHTAPELVVRKVAHSLGLRFRLHRKDLPGTPDLVFPKYRTAIFVHGCFWHRHEGCRKASTPGTRTDFWLTKFARNKERDKRNVADLEAQGWRVLIIWECQTQRPQSVEAILKSTFDGIDNLGVPNVLSPQGAVPASDPISRKVI